MSTPIVAVPQSNSNNATIKRSVTINDESWPRYDVGGTVFLVDPSGAHHQFPDAGRMWGFVAVMRALAGD